MDTCGLESPIDIKASGVVLRGEGMRDIGSILIGKIAKDTPAPLRGRPALVNIGGAPDGRCRKKRNRPLRTNAFRLGNGKNGRAQMP